MHRGTEMNPLNNWVKRSKKFKVTVVTVHGVGGLTYAEDSTLQSEAHSTRRLAPKSFFYSFHTFKYYIVQLYWCILRYKVFYVPFYALTFVFCIKPLLTYLLTY